MATCNLCGDKLPDTGEDMLAHLRVLHPDQYEEPERWPDGSIVVYDQTLKPEEF